MPDEALLTITLVNRGDEFHAELLAPSRQHGMADLRLSGTNRNAIDALQTCLTELQAKAADGDPIALRFA